VRIEGVVVEDVDLASRGLRDQIEHVGPRARRAPTIATLVSSSLLCGDAYAGTAGSRIEVAEHGLLRRGLDHRVRARRADGWTERTGVARMRM